MSAGLGQFWLGSSLKISADEQVAFVDRLRRGALPLSQRSMDIVKSCIVQRDAPGLVYRGKTGSDRGPGPDLGWWVGWVERDQRSYVFAINVSGDGTWGPQARRAAERTLIDLGVLPASAD
jgi:beta-lactamase class D